MTKLTEHDRHRSSKARTRRSQASHCSSFGGSMPAGGVTRKAAGVQHGAAESKFRAILRGA
jgi:hypothetical protein